MIFKNSKKNPSSIKVTKSIEQLDEFFSSPKYQEVIRNTELCILDGMISSAKESFDKVLSNTSLNNFIPNYINDKSFDFFEITSSVREKENGYYYWSIYSGDYQKYGDGFDSWRNENVFSLHLHRDDELFSAFWAEDKEECNFSHEDIVQSLFLSSIIDKLKELSFYSLKFRANKADFIAQKRYEKSPSSEIDLKKGKIYHSILSLERELLTYYEQNKLKDATYEMIHSLLFDLKEIAPFIDNIIDPEKKYRIQKTLLKDAKTLIREYVLLNSQLREQHEVEFQNAIFAIGKTLKVEISGIEKKDNNSFLKQLKLIEKRY